MYYPPATRKLVLVAPEAGSALQVTDEGQASAAVNSTSTDKPVEETECHGALEGAGTSSQEAP